MPDVVWEALRTMRPDLPARNSETPSDTSVEALVEQARWRAGSIHRATSPSSPFAQLTDTELFDALADAIEQLSTSAS